MGLSPNAIWFWMKLIKEWDGLSLENRGVKTHAFQEFQNTTDPNSATCPWGLQRVGATGRWCYLRERKITILTFVSVVFVVLLLALYFIVSHPSSTAGSSVSSTTSSALPILAPVNASGWSQLRGTNYNWYNLTGEGSSAPPPNVSFPLIREDGFNLVRVQFFWANYLQNVTQYLSALRNVAYTAQENGLYVDFVMMDYGTGPQFGGFGFPFQVTQNYTTQQTFWSDGWYPDAISLNGTTGWNFQLQVWKSVIGAVDNYSSVVGYEIMNEPPIWNAGQISQLATLQTYMASHLREMTDKWILFSRPYLEPGSNLATNGEPTLQEMLKAAPSNVSRLVFAPHRYGYYSAPGCTTCTDGIFLNYSMVSKTLNVPVFVGEWSIVNLPATTWTENEMDFLLGYIGYMHFYGFAWAYEGWQEGTIFNSNDPDEWQYQLNYNGSQWALDVGLSEAIAQYYGVTSDTTSTASAEYTGSVALSFAFFFNNNHPSIVGYMRGSTFGLCISDCDLGPFPRLYR
jgi:hypothetical protein